MKSNLKKLIKRVKEKENLDRWLKQEKAKERKEEKQSALTAGRHGAVVDVHQDSVGTTTCLGLVAVARVVATSGQGVRTSDQTAVGCRRASVTLCVVLCTADRETASCTGVKAVGDGSVAGTTSHAHGVGQQATISAISVASHQVPSAIAGASAELADPGVVHVHGKTVSSTAILGLVAAASHVAVGGLGAGSGSSVRTVTLASIFCACILVV
jgi:hypothetical protein